MPYRRRIRRVTMGKDGIKKAGTLIASPIGPASPITDFTIAETPNARTSGGATQAIRGGQDTNEMCNVGDIIKYVNLRIQTGARDSVEPEDETSGWLEWAVVKYKENFFAPSSSQLGVETLGTVCTRAFRGDCLLTGAIPVGGDQPSIADIVIKIPKIWCKMQIGSTLHLFCHFRSVNAASTAVDLNTSVLSFNYKNYV